MNIAAFHIGQHQKLGMSDTNSLGVVFIFFPWRGRKKVRRNQNIMSYSFDYKNIFTGDIMLVSSPTLLGEAIQSFEKCDYNHASVCFWNLGQLYLCEALEHGIAITPMDDYLKGDSKLLICRPGFKIDQDDAVKFLLKYPGNYPYGFLNLFVLQPIRFIFHTWLGEKIVKTPRRFICGQFAGFFINHFNPAIFKNWPEIAPSDIYNNINFTHILLNA